MTFLVPNLVNIWDKKCKIVYPLFVGDYKNPVANLNNICDKTFFIFLLSLLPSSSHSINQPSSRPLYVAVFAPFEVCYLLL